MSAFKIFCVALSLALAAPAFGTSASRTRLLASPNPAKLGQTVKLVGEVDGFGGGAPTGTVSFTNGDVTLGTGMLSPYGAGQATMSAGGRHNCVLSADGGVACWGVNTHGQLGDGTATFRPTPVVVSGLSSRAVAIAVGYAHTCALTTVGGVKCWGNNSNLELGIGTRSEGSRTPVSVSGLSSGVVAIAAGSRHTCALTSAGAVKCWGHNSRGQIGDGTFGSARIPVAVAGLSSGVVAIDAGGYTSCALTSAGAVKCWGENSYGQLGDGTQFHRRTPVSVSGLSSGVVAISSGGVHTCAVTSSHGVKCWGSNQYGELGDGTTQGRLTPVDVATLSTGVVAVAARASHSCALKGGGVLLCWGRNVASQLGDRTKTDRHTPVAVPGHTRGVAAIMTGSDYTCVSMLAGVVRCWGYNQYGTIGDGTTKTRPSPTPVAGVTALVRARAPLLVNSLGAGTHTLRATYSGDAAHSQSSGSRAQTIVP